MTRFTNIMKKRDSPVSTVYLATVLALVCSASAHSWVENVARIAANGTMVGIGYPRGFKERSSPGWSDEVPMLRLPATGTAFYTGNEVMNKFKFTDKPQFPMLEAAPGDHVAFNHHENGHVSLPQNQPNKPRNRGTIFFYGTSQPKEDEKLFDVHLRWNKEGTGGDKRGILLATRNYDDGQCYQPNHQAIANDRVAKLKGDGANPDMELTCQADVKLPSDLKPGSVYTVYWYWDWPDLNAQKMDIEKTKDGNFPWAGSFMRGDQVPNGWKMDAISKNESYASVVDIKITNGPPQAMAAKDAGANDAGWVAQQNIYSKAVREQMTDNYQVKVAGLEKGDATPPPSAPASVPATAAPPPNPAAAPPQPSIAAPPQQNSAAAPPQPPAMATSAANGGVLTVTRTETVPPTTLLTTTYRTVLPRHGDRLQ